MLKVVMAPAITCNIEGVCAFEQKVGGATKTFASMQAFSSLQLQARRALYCTKFRGSSHWADK
jgi:hypothetical protein